MDIKQTLHEKLSPEEIVKFFEQQDSILQEIKEKGFSAYTETLTNLTEAFKEKTKSVCCMDEGTPGGCFHTAGSGILRDKSEVLDYYRKAGVTEITSHDGCGAAGLYAKANGLDASKADEYGKEWSQAIARELGVSYRHIIAEEMHRPEGQHIARVAYYDNTGKFDYSKVKELPVGFIISHDVQSLKDNVDDAMISFNIATGGHGFGELITEEKPFIICVIGKDENDLEKLKSELSGLTEHFGKKVKIDGFICPKE